MAKEVAGDLFLISVLILLVHFGTLFVLAFKLWTLGALTAGALESLHLWPALLFTVKQALLTAIVSVLIGIAAAPGFGKLGAFQKPIRWVLLFPSLLSPVLGALALLITIKNFPYGLWGIVLAQTFLNAGLATLWLGEIWKNLEDRWEPVGVVLGIPRFWFQLKVILPQLLPGLLNVLAVIFSFSLSSFAMPLIFGGGPQNSTLEVLLYERLRTEGDLSAALWVGLAQALIQVIFFVLILRFSLIMARPTRLMTYPKRSWSSFLTLLVVGGLFLPVFNLFKDGINQIGTNNFVSAQLILEPALNSVVTSLLVSLLCLILLSFADAFKIKDYVLRAPALSGVVVGLGALVLVNTLDLHSQWTFILLLVYGHLSVIFIPALRLAAPRLLMTRFNYEKVLTQLGSSKLLGLKKVFWPLNFRVYISTAILAGLWSMGEFSVSRTLSGEFLTLPVVIQNLMGSYRLEIATTLSLILLVLTVLSLTLFEVFAHVLD